MLDYTASSSRLVNHRSVCLPAVAYTCLVFSMAMMAMTTHTIPDRSVQSGLSLSTRQFPSSIHECGHSTRVAHYLFLHSSIAWLCNAGDYPAT